MIDVSFELLRRLCLLLPVGLAISWSQFSSAEILFTARNSPVGSACLEAYADLLGGENLKIRVVFGYKDARPARFVGDRHERLAFVTQLLKACEPGEGACGFRRHPDNADLFTKRVIGPMDNPVDVELYVVNSSVGSDDQGNRADPYQVWQSQYAHKAFFEGTESADIVFYNGHSRFGGGPDFTPPRLSPQQSPDVSYYKSQRPGFKKLLKSLQTRSEKPEGTTGATGSSDLLVLGLFSCSSSRHFVKALPQNREVAFVATDDLLHYADAQRSSLETLSKLLQLHCDVAGLKK